MNNHNLFERFHATQSLLANLLGTTRRMLNPHLT